MSIFRNNAEERTLEDILTPRIPEDADEETDGEKENAEMTSDDDSIDSDVVKAPEKSESEEEKPQKDIKIATPEEISFNALTCFGWSETKTPKWMIKCAHFWYSTMSFMWFLLGAVTFAPIMFMQSKVNVIFKDKFKSFIASSLIYTIFVGLLILFFATRGSSGSEAASAIILR